MEREDKKDKTGRVVPILAVKLLIIAALAGGFMLCDFFRQRVQYANMRARIENLFQCRIDESYRCVYSYSDGFTDMDYMWVFEGEGEPAEFLESVQSRHFTAGSEEEFDKHMLAFGREEYRVDITQEYYWCKADVYDGGGIVYAPHEGRIYFYAYTM